MSITRSKSINTIYEECKDFDLVLVPDAPLASAINRRLDHPQFGPFAISPRRLAAKRREQAEDRLAFLKLINETDLNWKEAAYAVGNILQCWEYSGSIDAILEYDALQLPQLDTAVDRIAEMDTTSRQLTEYSVADDISVAVVGIEQFTELERSILPVRIHYDRSVHRRIIRSSTIPPPRLSRSDHRYAARHHHRANAGDVAVVLDQASEYASLVESALEAESIPYYGGPGFTDDPHHQRFPSPPSECTRWS